MTTSLATAPPQTAQQEMRPATRGESSGRGSGSLSIAALVTSVILWPLGAVLSLLALRASLRTGGSGALAVLSACLSVVSAALSWVLLGGVLLAAGASSADEEPWGSSYQGTGPVVALGEAALVGDYFLVVQEFRPATQEVLEAHAGNATPRGEYVLASVTATYGGTGAGEVYADLYAALLGADGLVYDTSTCADALAPGDVYATQPLGVGGSSEFAVCFDVPAAALEGASVVVETMDGSSAVRWA